MLSFPGAIALLTIAFAVWLRCDYCEKNGKDFLPVVTIHRPN